MDYYHNKENVQNYISMMKNYDNSTVINKLKSVLPKNSKVLELGTGAAADYEDLNSYYNIFPSDFSLYFIEEFLKKNPYIPIYHIDAKDFSLDEKFDCIYSNKVLYHLTKDELRKSLIIQTSHLKEKGIIFMTLWNGKYKEEQKEDMIFTYYEENDIREIIPDTLSVKEISLYDEFEKNDSMFVILEKI